MQRRLNNLLQKVSSRSDATRTVFLAQGVCDDLVIKCKHIGDVFKTGGQLNQFKDRLDFLAL